ncbi:MAG: hypothetical protein ABI891_07115 [Acidobacteriota bacterium]
MQEISEKTNDKTNGTSETGNASAFKPSISIKRKQTRRIALQVDEEKADSLDEYVRFVSECCGYEVSAGDVMNEILKAHFARDTGFKQWRATAKNEAATMV